ncbi:MAG: hypothetical protein AAGA75_13470, partial [Cyanobacteria bacterium P01_E01_bin.6]
ADLSPIFNDLSTFQATTHSLLHFVATTLALPLIAVVLLLTVAQPWLNRGADQNEGQHQYPDRLNPGTHQSTRDQYSSPNVERGMNSRDAKLLALPTLKRPCNFPSLRTKWLASSKADRIGSILAR